MYAIIYSENAQDDLTEIMTYYWQQGGWELAQNMEQRITADIHVLAYNPNIAKQSQLVAGFRERIIYQLPYRALFLVDETAQEIVIAAIVYTSRKLP
ncbi:type II toxin-antitoxin system RelE/ParE family toxin [Neisseriaceae bacterium B1]